MTPRPLRHPARLPGAARRQPVGRNAARATSAAALFPFAFPFAFAAVATAACSAPISTGEGPSSPLVRSDLRLEPLAGTETLGAITAVHGAGDLLLVAGAKGFALFSTGAPASLAALGTASILSATTAPAALTGARFLAVTGDGRLLSLTSDGTTQDVSARYGLDDGTVRYVSTLAPLLPLAAADAGSAMDGGGMGLAAAATRTAFALTDGYAIEGGGKVQRVKLASTIRVIPCGARTFVQTASALYRLGDTGLPAYVITFPAAMPMTGAACDTAGRLLATSDSLLWQEDGTALAPRVTGAGFGGLVALNALNAGAAFLAAGRPCVFDGVVATCAEGLAPAMGLYASATRYPWVSNAAGLFAVVEGLSAGADGGADGATRPTDASIPQTDGSAVDRDASDASRVDGAARDAGPVDAALSASEQTWNTVVRPIAERACLGCHGGADGSRIRLSTYASWVTNRNAIRDRAVTQRNMPPVGAAPLSDADRTALAGWLGN